MIVADASANVVTIGSAVAVTGSAVAVTCSAVAVTGSAVAVIGSAVAVSIDADIARGGGSAAFKKGVVAVVVGGRCLGAGSVGRIVAAVAAVAGEMVVADVAGARVERGRKSVRRKRPRTALLMHSQ